MNVYVPCSFGYSLLFWLWHGCLPLARPSPRDWPVLQMECISSTELKTPTSQTHPTLEEYRKRPCISRTFFHKTEAKNRGRGLFMDTSVFRVHKNLINIHETS
mgnify:CR=1 FL=1